MHFDLQNISSCNFPVNQYDQHELPPLISVHVPKYRGHYSKRLNQILPLSNMAQGKRGKTFDKEIHVVNNAEVCYIPVILGTGRDWIKTNVGAWSMAEARVYSSSPWMDGCINDY